MTTLKQIWKENGSLYRTPMLGSPLFQKKDVKEWLQQKRPKTVKQLAKSDAILYRIWIDELLEELEQ